MCLLPIFQGLLPPILEGLCCPFSRDFLPPTEGLCPFSRDFLPPTEGLCPFSRDFCLQLLKDFTAHFPGTFCLQLLKDFTHIPKTFGRSYRPLEPWNFLHQPPTQKCCHQQCNAFQRSKQRLPPNSQNFPSKLCKLCVPNNYKRNSNQCLLKTSYLLKFVS